MPGELVLPLKPPRACHHDNSSDATSMEEGLLTLPPSALRGSPGPRLHCPFWFPKSLLALADLITKTLRPWGSVLVLWGLASWVSVQSSPFLDSAQGLVLLGALSLSFLLCNKGSAQHS